MIEGQGAMSFLGVIYTAAFLGSELGLAWIVKIARRTGGRRIECLTLLSAETVLFGYASYVTSGDGPIARMLPGTWGAVPLIAISIVFLATICWGIFYVGRS